MCTLGRKTGNKEKVSIVKETFDDRSNDMGRVF